jgi:hypothetical protein
MRSRPATRMESACRWERRHYGRPRISRNIFSTRA